MVPLDGSSNSIRGLNQAISLARQSDGIITGIHVLPQFSRSQAKKTRSLRNILSRKANSYMKQAKISAARHGIDFVPKITTSKNTVKTITGFAKQKKYGLIVIGSRGLSSPRADFLGSISFGVVNSSRIPALIVK